MSLELNELNKKIVNCRKCKRLVLFREKVAREKRKMFYNENYWGKNLPINKGRNNFKKIRYE